MARPLELHFISETEEGMGVGEVAKMFFGILRIHMKERQGLMFSLHSSRTTVTIAVLGWSAPVS